MPEQESKYSDEIAALRKELAAARDELLRVRARESRLKSEHGKYLENASNEEKQLRAQIAEFKNREKNLKAEKASLKKHCDELERENKILKGSCPLDGKSPAVCSGMANAREFIATLPAYQKELLAAASFAPQDVTTFLSRCGSRAGIIEIWKAARQHILAYPDYAQKTLPFLEAILRIHALGNGPEAAVIYEPDLASIESDEASGYWVIPFRENWWEEADCVRETLLPGLLDVEGVLLVEPLLALTNGN